MFQWDWIYSCSIFLSHFKIEDEKISYLEKVVGTENGSTEVKATVQLLPNGDLHSKTQYFQNEKWVDGHEIYYKEIIVRDNEWKRIKNLKTHTPKLVLHSGVVIFEKIVYYS